MKRLTSLLLVIAFAGAILLPVNVTVNNRSGEKLSIADGGVPIPPWPPCVTSGPSDSALSV
jgi:hypothetical protein